MCRTIETALIALYLIIFANSTLSAPVPTFGALSSVPSLPYPSYRGRQAVGVNAHHTSTKHTAASSLFSYSYFSSRLHISQRDESYHQKVNEIKKPSYETSPPVSINAHHTSSQHKSLESEPTYGYSEGSLYDPETGRLGCLKASIFTAENVSACNDKAHSPSQPPVTVCYGAQAHLSTPPCPDQSSSPQPLEYKTMPGGDEGFPSSWVLMHWKIPHGYSKLFTEDVFEWALWLLGLALVIAVDIELLSMWNARYEKVMEGAGVKAELENTGTEDLCQAITNATRENEKDVMKNEALKSQWNPYDKISLTTRKHKLSQSKVGEGRYQDIDDNDDDDTDENGMEKSSW